MVRHAATTVALTDVEAEQVRAYAGNVVTAVVPNGVGPRPAGPGGMAFRHSLGIPADVPLALFVGRLDVRHKGLDRLVAATVDAPTWRFLFVGPDHRGGHRRLQRMAADLGTSARVYLVGPLGEPAPSPALMRQRTSLSCPPDGRGCRCHCWRRWRKGSRHSSHPEWTAWCRSVAPGPGGCPLRASSARMLEAIATLPAAEWSRRAEAARQLAQATTGTTSPPPTMRCTEAACQRWAAITSVARGASSP